jgi:nucleoid DNA-binding protein
MGEIQNLVPGNVPAKYTPHFKAGKELRERVDYDC